MSKVSSLISKIAIAGVSFLSMASSALAYEYSYEYDMGSDAAGGLMAFLGGGFGLVVALCSVLLYCVSLIFNIWMIVDVIKRTEAELPNRTMWLILLILGLLFTFGGLVALIYFFSARKKLAK